MAALSGRSSLFALIDNGLPLARPRLRPEVPGVPGDFVITRIRRPWCSREILRGPHEMSDQDIQWTRIVELELVPHPDQPRPEITEMDYSMRDGVLRMKLRAATAGYILRKWSVDCSPTTACAATSTGFWLRDHLAIHGVRNAVLAPGYAACGNRWRGGGL